MNFPPMAFPNLWVTVGLYVVINLILFPWVAHQSGRTWWYYLLAALGTGGLLLGGAVALDFPDTLGWALTWRFWSIGNAVYALTTVATMRLQDRRRK